MYIFGNISTTLYGRAIAESIGTSLLGKERCFWGPQYRVLGVKWDGT
jgi:hypothetical protein